MTCACASGTCIAGVTGKALSPHTLHEADGGRAEEGWLYSYNSWSA